MKVELLSNGMILFDNGEEIVQVFPASVKFIRVFPSEPDPKTKAKRDNWTVSVGGDMWIEFYVHDREEGDNLRLVINEILDTFTANGANGMHYG